MILMMVVIVIITMMIHDGDVQVIVMIDGPHDARMKVITAMIASGVNFQVFPDR